MSSRIRIAAAAALVAAAVLAGALVLTGGASGDAAELSWDGKPRLMKSGKPTDRILYGRMKNTSLEPVDLDIERAKVVTEDGDEVRSTVVFLEAFAHSLFAWSQRPAKLTDFERRRLGQIATVKPGQSIPLTVSWRVPAGSAPPERVEFGTATLEFP